MKLTELFLAELEREAPRTRRAIEQVPLGRDDWAPHSKSMPLGRLAGLVGVDAVVGHAGHRPGRAQPDAGAGREPVSAAAMDKLVEVHDGHIAKARESLLKTNDDYTSSFARRSTTSRTIAGN